MDDSGKTHMVNVQDVKIMYLVNGLIKCLPDDKAFGHEAKYHTQPPHLNDPHWSLNSKV